MTNTTQSAGDKCATMNENWILTTDHLPPFSGYCRVKLADDTVHDAFFTSRKDLFTTPDGGDGFDPVSWDQESFTVAVRAAIRSAEAEPWIAVETGLPLKDALYLVSKNQDREAVDVARFDPAVSKWFADFTEWDVVAWQPLPAPYIPSAKPKT